jgi:2-polyprenyl-3-methyl-5-hydroxy-6-metoxy-1,4-benzoquinol methylase
MGNDMHADGDNPHSNHNHARSRTEPSEILVSAVNGLPPGRVLDVGSGSGGDAIWLASNGWQVTAVDISQAAIDRAKTAADGTGMAITWVCADVARMTIDPGQYDLISIQYPALRRDTHQQVINTLLKAVAPGGTILVVTHGPESDSCARSYGIEPADYIDTADFAAALDDNWEIAIKETRPHIARRDGSPFTHDVVLLAHPNS